MVRCVTVSRAVMGCVPAPCRWQFMYMCRPMVRPAGCGLGSDVFRWAITPAGSLARAGSGGSGVVEVPFWGRAVPPIPLPRIGVRRIQHSFGPWWCVWSGHFEPGGRGLCPVLPVSLPAPSLWGGGAAASGLWSFLSLGLCSVVRWVTWKLVCGGLLCCGILCWRLFVPHYRGATRRGQVRSSVNFLWVSAFCTTWSGIWCWRRGSDRRLCGTGYHVGWRPGCDLAGWFRPAWSLLRLAWVGWLAGYGAHLGVGMPSLGVRAGVVVPCRVFRGFLRLLRMAGWVAVGVSPSRVFVLYPAPMLFPVPGVVVAFPCLP